LINQTLGAVINGTGQAGQIIIDQLVGAVNNVAHHSKLSNNVTCFINRTFCYIYLNNRCCQPWSFEFSWSKC
jgi:hypothetical protein